MDIGDKLRLINDRIDAACRRSGRPADSVALMAVTKNHDAETVAAAYKAGLRLFGENRIQEAASKFPSSDYPDARPHLIGSLQRNKVKLSLTLFSRIESVDRIELIHELAKRAQNVGQPMEILFELRTGEDSKAGFPNEDALLLGVETALAYPVLRIKGLMTMAPFTEDTAVVRQAFRVLRKVRNKAMTRFPEADWSTLSMGMTSDFETAIEEGSTQVRIGTALFGSRI